jgi:hypothetical protein
MIASSNPAIAFTSVLRITTGGNNTANGFGALLNNTTGASNTADGINALRNNTTGSSNIALGASAGTNLTTGSNNIAIGNAGVAGESGRIRIGTSGSQTQTFIAGISGVAVTGSQVVVNGSGKLGVTASSARFKEEIKSMDKASEAIIALNPVTFRYKQEIDPKSSPQFGLLAEEVAKVNPDLVIFDESGKPYTVRYEAVNAMLLNEFLKEHRKGLEQEAKIAAQEKKIETLELAMKEQLAQIQKIAAQLQVSQDTARVAEN